MNPVTDAELIMMTLHDAKNGQTWSSEFNAQIDLAIEAVRRLERENADLRERLQNVGCIRVACETLATSGTRKFEADPEATDK